MHITGVILRDSHGVAQVRFVTGNKILRILKKKGMAPDLPEDLYHLIKKAVNIRKHMERNRKVGTSVMLSLNGVPLCQIISLWCTMMSDSLTIVHHYVSLAKVYHYVR